MSDFDIEGGVDFENWSLPFGLIVYKHKRKGCTVTFCFLCFYLSLVWI